jgi:glycosyltransferase involved in cell wall biosynthesis
MTSAVHRRLKIALVAPSMAILGGQAIQAARLLDSWRDDPEIEAWLVPINPSPPAVLRRAAGVKFVRTAITQLTYWPSLLIQLRQADIVHVFSASYWSFLLAPLPAVVVARLLGKPIVMNYRSGEAPDHLKRSAIARAILRHVDRNIVPSAFLRDVFDGFDIDAEVIPNIVDTVRYAFRERTPLSPRVLSTRNFETLYNLPCTLRAFRRFQEWYPAATLTLVGSGTQEAAVRTLADSLELTGVSFAGRVAPDQMWRFYADADIYLQTPDIDNMPSSLLEAFASGCAAVSTDAGGVPAMLSDDVHGLLVSCNDDRAAAVAMRRLMQDAPLAARLTKAARESCARYQWTSVRARWLAVYRELAGVAGVPAARIA